jgi:hypothetical protein
VPLPAANSDFAPCSAKNEQIRVLELFSILTAGVVKNFNLHLSNDRALGIDISPETSAITLNFSNVLFPDALIVPKNLKLFPVRDTTIALDRERLHPQL